METIKDSVKKYKKELILGPIFKTIEVIFELFTPLLMKLMIDEGINEAILNNDYTKVIYPSLLILLFTIFGFCSTFICQYFASIASQGSGTDLRNRLYRKINNLSLKEIEKEGKGNVLTLVSNDVNRIQLGIAYLIRLAIRAPLLVIGSLIMCAFVNINAFLIILTAVIIISIIIAIIFVFSSKQVLRVQEKTDDIISLSNDDFSGVRVIKAFNKEEDEIKKFSDNTESYYKEAKKNNLLNALVSPLTYLCVNGAAILIVLLGKEMINDLNFGLSSGDLVSLIAYLNQILTALLVVFNLVVVFTKALASRKRVNNFLKMESSIKNGELKEVDYGSKNIPILKFEDVSFRYEDDSNVVIKDINFDIFKGETVGIIGGTGSGKTTLIRLMERFFDASGGKIYFKGNDIKDYDLDYLHSNIAFISQKTSIFNTTIKENVAMNKEINDEKVIEALKNADAYEFVSKYQDSIDHELTESGKDLSGGQKQRISIARALYKKGEVLVLDDSTSALDFLTDKKVRNNIKSIKNMTTIIISQRASSLQDCDKIIVMYHGYVESIGTHEELLEKSRIYREIYETQVRNYERN